MSNITHIILHNTGGLGNDNYASTKHVTLEHINNAHAHRWEKYKHEWKAYTSELGYHVGYNVLVFRDGSWKQTRLIGEQTAGATGYNYNSVHICNIGNFNIGVDRLTDKQLATTTMLNRAIISGNPQSVGLKVKEGTKINVPIKNIIPHRAVSTTMCYGTSLSDSLFRDKIVKDITMEINVLTKLLNAYLKVVELLSKKEVRDLKGDNRFDDPENLPFID